MRKTKITRFLCLFLALITLVSTATVAVSANDSDGVTDKSIADYVSELNTISYEEYVLENSKYFSDPDTDFAPIRFGTNSNWVFVADGDKTITVTDATGAEVELRSGAWWMQIELALGAWTLSIKETLKNEDGEIYHNTVATYDSVEAAVEAGIADKQDLVFLAEFGEGDNRRVGLYTPGLGSTTWTLDLAAAGIDAGLYTIEIEYFPVAELDGKMIAKSSSVEREFYINGKAPFSEARALKLAKIWSSFKPDGVSALTATYKVGKKETVDEVISAAKAAGLTATPGSDNASVIIDQPAVVTPAINEFISNYNLRFMVTDADRNELRPTMAQTPEWTTYTFHDSEGYSSIDFGFVIEADENGKTSFTLDGVNESMTVSAIILKPYEKPDTYVDYLASVKETVGLNEGQSTIKLESEYTTHTSTNVVYPIEDRTSPLTSPADPSRMMLNTIGTEKWATAGQWVEYKFAVDGSGLYEIYSRYRQSYLDGMYVCRSLKIFTDDYASAEEYEAKFGNTVGYYNGVPFAEAAEIRYDYGNGWQVTGLTNGEDVDGDGKVDFYQIYFEKGVTYTLRLEVTLGSMSEQVQKIESILNDLNDDYLSIIKLTGTTPDDYRDYKFTTLLPLTLWNMYDQAVALNEVSTFLKDTAKVASTYSGTCDKLENLLLKLVDDPDSIAKNLSNLKSYVGNLGTFLSDAKTQPLQLDYITIQPASVKAPKAEGNFFQTMWHEILSFIQSFFRDYNSMGSMDDGTTSKSVNVWLAYGRDQSQVIRNLSTNEFTPDSNIAVDLKLVTGSTLLPSILAGMGPDVYLGLGDATVINYAIRGALQNVEDKESFNEIVDACFNRAAMLQLEISDSEGVIHTYGLPETQTFQMMFVRLDILGELGIEIPKTWDELHIAQSKLESNNMEIGITTSYKPFLYQSGGDLYADEGMRINLDSQEGLAAFEKMCNMFTQYSFPYKYDAANRFRTGEYPIILASYTDLYNKLKVFATEIEGLWTFVPIPGTRQADGSINNTADCTIAAVVMISGQSEDQQTASWEFMKWYTGAEAQSRYANEMVAIIGDSAKHPTANRVALKNMPWTRDEYKEVSRQFENLAAIPNYPGSYYIDRHTDFAFLAAYNKNEDPTTELLSYINTINNEITRKREEFKLETLQIGQTLASKRMDQAMVAMDLLAKIDNEKYGDAIEAALYAIANASKKVLPLDEASATFAKFLEYDYITALDAIEQDKTLSNVMKTAKQKEITEKVKTYAFFKNVTKQTAEDKNGGYSIDSLSEEQLVYFVTECLRNAADAQASYKSSK